MKIKFDCGKATFSCCAGKHDEKTAKIYLEVGGSFQQYARLCFDQVSNAKEYGWETLILRDNFCSKCETVFPELRPNQADGTLICLPCQKITAPVVFVDSMLPPPVQYVLTFNPVTSEWITKPSNRIVE